MLKVLFILLLNLPLIVEAQHKNILDIKDEKKYILFAFNKIEIYMDADRYDLAQVWLNKIYLKHNYQKPSTFSYFLTSRQAEVYYYNNLLTLGMHEAINAEQIAMVLKDSLLISDAYNFIGLFYLNSHKLKKAKYYFKRSLIFTSQPPYKKKYYELSKPHHIYGNLAETFQELEQPDSSILYSKISLQKALEIKSLRGMATAYLNLGTAYHAINKIDSAFKYFNNAINAAHKSNNFDVELVCYSNLSNSALAQSNTKEAFNQLSCGFFLLKKYPKINHFYSLKFLEVAIIIYKKFNNTQLLTKTLELKSKIQTIIYNTNNTQVQNLFLIALQNQKRISGLEIAQVKYIQSLAVTKIYILLMVFIAFIIAFIAYRYYALQEIRLANLRIKISRDLHDEIGATLSGIALYSYITNNQIKNNDHKAVKHSLELIKNNATLMVTKLNDIVWAINPIQDNFLSFIERLKEFAVQIAATKNIEIDFFYNFAQLNEIKLPMLQRKNIFLICKEAVNNAIKYSECTVLSIQINLINNNIKVEIADNGIGFLYSVVKKGNGLINMNLRAEEIKANFKIISTINGGTTISLICKIP